MPSVRSVVFAIVGEDRFSASALKAAATADTVAGRMGASMAKVAANAEKAAAVGKKMSLAITLPVVAAGAMAVKQAEDFQKSQTLLQTAGGETADKMAVISKGIKDLAVQTGTSLQQLNDGMYTVAKFGNKFSATDQLLILKAAAEGAKAENVDLSVATNALTTVMQSYGLKASDAVRVQNELVTAAGRSKTNMTDFADSLSNVIPLASSLGISFAQVGGAIATMTQHGETAQRATDNLNNFIRNLAGQNNVAAAAMQQLGINTIDLQKNLGTVGLTGTLKTVEDALARSSKGGLVVVNSFRQAQLATGSLNTMLGTMTGDLAKQSKGLLSGTVGIKDYTAYAKSMGGASGAAALQFLSLYKQTLGFNNQLKSGKGDVSTAAAQLQKMLGGATGLNVALMLGGASAKTFTDNAAAIGAASKKSGADIDTWGKTASTAAVKTQQAKEKLQVLAVNVGDKLIPVALKIVSVFSTVVTWFSRLSSGTQGTIIKVALLAAALGPVISVVSRLVKTGALIVGWGAKIAASFADAAAAAAAAAADEAVTAAAYARFEAEKAEAVAAAAGKIALSLKGTDSVLAADSAAAARNAEVFAAAQREKALAAEASAIQIRAAAAGTGAGAGAGAAGTGAAAGSFLPVALPVAAIVAVGYAIHKVVDAGTNAISTMHDLAHEVGGLTTALQGANGALTQNAALLVAQTLQHDGLADKAAKAGVSLTQLTEGVTGTKQQYDALVAAWKAGGKPSDDTLAKLGLLYTAYGLSGAAAKRAAADTKSANAAAAKTATDTAAQVKAAAHAAYLAANPTFAAFESVMKSVNRSTGDIQGATDAFATSLGELGLKGKTAQTGLADTGTAAGTASDRLKSAAQNAVSLAAAMSANGASSEDVAAKLENNVIVLEQMASKLGLDKGAVDDLIRSMNLTPTQIDTYFNVSIAAALANIAILKSQLASLGGIGDAESRAEGNKIAGQLAAAQTKLSGSVGSVASGGTASHTSGSSGSLGGGSAGGGGGGSSTPKFSTATITAFLKSLTGTAGDVSSAFQALLKSGVDAKKFSSKLVSSLNAEDKLLLAEVSKRNSVAAALKAANQRLTDAYAAYSDYRKSVAGSVTGTFDVSSVQSQYTDQGTSTSTIISAITRAVANAGKFSATIKALVGRHVAGGLIQQLLAAGPAALPQALALLAASPSQVALINTDYAKLAATGADLGTFGASTFYGAGVKSAQGLVAGLKSQESLLTKAVTSLADKMVAAIKKSLGIHSPSKVFHDLGVNTGVGFVNGVTSQHGAAQRSVAGLTNRPTPRTQAAGWGEYHHHDGDTFHVYEAVNPTATAQTVQRHQQMAGRS